ncbi:hypothetical protein CTAM01_03505 [Colletotrichum tamarilloi]|uniref:Uncharacterized protein n=1 Tax=Colletotrichum tamarilloi TaxID=1209934 RepID=A0ABQ9RJZ6_9PEZI|nr:uncharacterized protein CTAM01_03505 [Colletotrichum tamarilloi]KAK1506170.1 hypothetical protein CTAM01_03505 [Colletotrichum tamarilloi]
MCEGPIAYFPISDDGTPSWPAPAGRDCKSYPSLNALARSQSQRVSAVSPLRTTLQMTLSPSQIQQAFLDILARMHLRRSSWSLDYRRGGYDSGLLESERQTLPRTPHDACGVSSRSGIDYQRLITPKLRHLVETTEWRRGGNSRNEECE